MQNCLSLVKTWHIWGTESLTSVWAIYLSKEPKTIGTVPSLISTLSSLVTRLNLGTSNQQCKVPGKKKVEPSTGSEEETVSYECKNCSKFLQNQHLSCQRHKASFTLFSLCGQEHILQLGRAIWYDYSTGGPRMGLKFTADTRL